MATQEIDMPVQRPIAARVASPRMAGATTPVTLGRPAAAARWRLTPFVLPLTAAVALGVHRWMPNQSPEPTRLYPRLLMVLIGLGIIIGVTQRLWRPSKLTFRSFAWAWPV